MTILIMIVITHFVDERIIDQSEIIRLCFGSLTFVNNDDHL